MHKRCQYKDKENLLVTNNRIISLHTMVWSDGGIRKYFFKDILVTRTGYRVETLLLQLEWSEGQVDKPDRMVD